MSEVKIAILGSGKGSNCEAILTAIEDSKINARPVVVFSDKPDAGIIEVARRHRVVVSHSMERVSQKELDQQIVQAIHVSQAELVVMAGLNRVVGVSALRAVHRHALNIHPAPLPEFGGLGMFGDRVFDAVLASNVTEAGPTVHVATEAVDQGPVVAHQPIPVFTDDTVASLKERTQAAEHNLYPVAIQQYIEQEFAYIFR